MLIKSSRFNIVYPKIENLRRKAFEIEDKLAPYFTKVTLIPVPDDALEEIPRISTTSHHGHSNLNISLTNTQLATNYDEKFEHNVKECLSYLKERMIHVLEALNSYLSNGFLFSGLTTEIIFDELAKENPLELMIDKLLNYKSELKPYEAEYKITFVLEDKYYVNITFRNVRFYDGLMPGGIIRFSDLQEKAHLLSVTLDVNDRYGFNFDKNYVSSHKEIEHIFTISDKILNNKLNTIIREGVFEL